MAITSQIKPVFELEEFIIDDWQSYGLLKPSIVKSVVTTIEKSLVIKKMGSLSEFDIVNLEKSIESMLGRSLGLKH